MRKLTLIKPAIYIYSIGFVCFSCNNSEEKLLAANLMTILFFDNFCMFLEAMQRYHQYLLIRFSCKDSYWSLIGSDNAI